MAESIARFNPVIAAQEMLNRIANTDLENHIDYLQSVKRYHKQLRDFFYPPIFENTQNENLDWSRYPAYEPNKSNPAPGLSGLVPVIVWGVMLGLVSIPLLKSNFIQNTAGHNA